MARWASPAFPIEGQRHALTPWYIRLVIPALMDCGLSEEAQEFVDAVSDTHRSAHGWLAVGWARQGDAEKAWQALKSEDGADAFDLELFGEMAIALAAAGEIEEAELCAGAVTASPWAAIVLVSVAEHAVAHDRDQALRLVESAFVAPADCGNKKDEWTDQRLAALALALAVCRDSSTERSAQEIGHDALRVLTLATIALSMA